MQVDSPQTNGILRRRFYRGVFVVAGVYNIVWGLFSTAYPNWLFDFADMPPMQHPEIFQCLAMVVGLYGLIYFEVARRPESGGLLAGVGLLGKILGPIGLAALILSGDWPAETLVLVATNDLIWWIPFSLYLWDWWAFRAQRATR